MPGERLRFFARCPWGVEAMLAPQLAAAAAPSARCAFGQVVPPTKSAACTVDTALPEVAADAELASLPTIPGVLYFDLVFDAQPGPDTLRAVVQRLCRLRMVEAIVALVTVRLNVSDMDAVKQLAAEPAFLEGVGRCVDVAKTCGVLEPYRSPIDLDAAAIGSLRSFGGSWLKSGKAVRETKQEQDAAAVAAVDAFFAQLADAPRSTPDPIERVVFRVSGTRMVKAVKTVTSRDIEDVLGFAIGNHFSDWHVSMRFSNVDVVALHWTDRLAVGVRVHEANIPRGNGTVQEQCAAELQRRALGQALASGKLTLDGARYAVAAPSHFKHDLRCSRGDNAMNPAIAAALLDLADLQPGQIVVDPMAGTGTIPMEAALRYPVVAVGGDIEAVNMPVERTNFERTTLELGCTAHGLPGAVGAAAVGARWNGCALPLRDGCVDAVVSDLPFGKRCGNAKVNAKVYPRFMREVARVLRVGGVAVLLSLEDDLIAELVAKDPRLQQRRQPHTIDMNGLLPHVFVLERVAPPGPDHPAVE